MNNATLKDWLDTAFVDAAGSYGKAPGDFWPGQAETTTLSWALMMRASHAVHGAEGPLDLCAPFGGGGHHTERAGLLTSLWMPHRHTHRPYEILLDLTAHRWSAPVGSRTLLASCESEASASHGTAMWDGYGWDFYKLMLVPSPLRIFVCRVGPRRGAPGPTRRDQLQATLEAHMAQLVLVREEEDQIGIVMFASEWRGDSWKDTRIWTDEDRVWVRPWL